MQRTILLFRYAIYFSFTVFGASTNSGWNVTHNNYHLFTETEGNSVFCGSETAVVARGEVEGNNGGRGATKHTAFPISRSR
jgi:hypothetical protein